MRLDKQKKLGEREIERERKKERERERKRENHSSPKTMHSPDTKIAQPPKLKLRKRQGIKYTAKVDGRRSKNCTNAEAKSAQPPKQNYTTAEIRLHDRRRTRERFPCPKWTTSKAQPPSKKLHSLRNKTVEAKKQNQKLHNRRSKNA